MDTQIIKYWDVIPRHPSLKWPRRSEEQIKKLVVHQLASPFYPNTHRDIDNNIKYFLKPNHVSAKGCPYIPYHVVIDDDGVIYWCNDFLDITWHCKGYNTESIGVGLIGSFDGPGFKGKDTNPTREQINSLAQVLTGLVVDLFTPLTKQDVYGHCELDPIRKPACPGNGAMTFLHEWRRK